MNLSTLKFNLISLGNSLNKTVCKKSKRKKHKKRSQNISIIRKHHLPKFSKSVLAKPTRFSKTEKILFSPKFKNSLMSNWYWSNYKKAVEWHNRNKTAHWKAYSFALQEKNKYLMAVIKNINPQIYEQLKFNQQNFCSRTEEFKESQKTESRNKSITYNLLADSNNGSKCDDEIQFEISEEMIQFFKESFKHKLNLWKLKEEIKTEDDSESKIDEVQVNKIKRTEEMSYLYGDGASMITGMETAVQLSFNKYCDTKSPKYWPNIPLRL